MTTEDLFETIKLSKRYESYRILKLWGIALISFPLVNLLHMILFDVWISYARNAEYIYLGLQGVVIIVLVVFFTRGFLSTKKLEIRDKKIVSRYYIKLGLAILVVFFFLVLIFMIAELLETHLEPGVAYKSFPAILGGTIVKIEGITIQIYWGDNLALLIGYLLLRNKKEGIKLIELPITVVLFTIFDILTVTLDPRLDIVILLEEYLAFIFSFFAVICGIIALIRAYKNLKKHNIFIAKETQ